MSNTTYKNGALLVQGNLFKTARRSYRISDIEKVNIKRPLFWLGLPLALGCIMLRIEYSAYLYDIEKQLCVVMFTAVPLILWNIGTLSLTSKSYRNDDAVMGFMPTLKKARLALENQIFKSYGTQIALEEDNG